MKTLATILVWGVCAVTMATEPATTKQIEDVLKAFDQLRYENSKLVQMVERLTEKVTLMERLKGEDSDEVPEIAIQKRVAGQWLIHPQTGMAVYAKSQWHTYNVGRVKVVELIRDGVSPVPVGSVVYGDGSYQSGPNTRLPAPERGGLPELARMR